VYGVIQNVTCLYFPIRGSFFQKKDVSFYVPRYVSVASVVLYKEEWGVVDVTRAFLQSTSETAQRSNRIFYCWRKQVKERMRNPRSLISFVARQNSGAVGM